ncbi:SUKH-4 family immunity protein [Streptomyces nigra]|uniref:SUKH-4 family immunity protein n=1 Tax=Streptomyces nigra TaxID=1827580 RepID=UPI0036B4190D
MAVSGAIGSGKTEVLLRLRGALPNPVYVDATGLTAEELLGKILDAFGVPDLWPRRGDWLWQLERAGVSGRPLLVANSHRAGRTRRSMQPSRVLKRVLGPLVRHAGVGSVSQPEWAAWLHLMATVRGDSRAAQTLEHSGIALPWRTRWAHWRPPYGWRTRYLRGGSVTEISEVEAGGRVAVAAKGRWDRRVRLWDADSGDLIAGPWSDGIPEPGQSEPLWPRGQDNDLAQGWTELNAFGSSLAGPQFTEVLRVGDGVVLAGIGGVVMVAPGEPDAFKQPEPTHGSALLGHFGLVDNNAQDFWDEPDRTVLEELFESQAVQRLEATGLPPGLRNEDARHVLREVGLPAFTGAEMSLVAVAEEGLTELTAEEVWGEDDGSGTYYLLGTWLDGRIVVHGDSGTVHRLPAEGEEDDSDPEVAASVSQFVTMLQNYVLGRCLLPMASSRTEREDVRDEIEDSLTAIDEDGDASRAWTYALYDND